MSNISNINQTGKDRFMSSEEERIEALKSEIKDIDVTVKRNNKLNPKLVVAIVALVIVGLHTLLFALLLLIYVPNIPMAILFLVTAAIIGVIVYLAMWYRQNAAQVVELNNKRDALRNEMKELQSRIEEDKK